MMCQKDDVAQKGHLSGILGVAKTDPNTSRQPRFQFLAGIKKTNSPENIYVRLVLAGN